MASAPAPSADIGFLYIGGIHQALHTAPLALALARRGVAVTAYALPDLAQPLARVLRSVDEDAAARVRVVPLALPRPLATLGATKVLSLLWWRRRLQRHDALVVAERTSTLLKRVPGRTPFLVYIPHGSGDRAIGFEARIRLFDHVLASGTVRRDRLVAEGTVAPERVSVIGGLKLSALLDTPLPPRPFADERPIVLYNPHFDPALSSWPLARATVEAILADARFNLIFAPHIRRAATLPAAERAVFEALGERDDCIVDFASPALSDMTWTRTADIYLGDVSSQVYEFIARPRPVLFLDAHGIAWQGNPDYRNWALGDVVTTPQEAVAALGAAQEHHHLYRARQEAFAAASLGPVGREVPDEAAVTLLDVLARQRLRARE